MPKVRRTCIRLFSAAEMVTILGKSAKSATEEEIS